MVTKIGLTNSISVGWSKLKVSPRTLLGLRTFRDKLEFFETSILGLACEGELVG